MGLCITDGSKMWPNGIVPYTIPESEFPLASARRGLIEHAIEIWNRKSGGHFFLIPRIATDPDYVRFEQADMPSLCTSPVGRQGGAQAIKCLYTILSRNEAAAVLMHEIGHAVGLKHEHQRRDRSWEKRSGIVMHDGEKYWKLGQPYLYEYVENSAFAKSQMGKINSGVLLVGKYDHDSIMHYENTAFAKSGCSGDKCITIKPAWFEADDNAIGGFIDITIGKSLVPSEGDIEALAKLRQIGASYSLQMSHCSSTQRRPSIPSK